MPSPSQFLDGFTLGTWVGRGYFQVQITIFKKMIGVFWYSTKSCSEITLLNKSFETVFTVKMTKEGENTVQNMGRYFGNKDANTLFLLVSATKFYNKYEQSVKTC